MLFFGTYILLHTKVEVFVGAQGDSKILKQNSKYNLTRLPEDYSSKEFKTMPNHYCAFSPALYKTVTVIALL